MTNKLIEALESILDGLESIHMFLPPPLKTHLDKAREALAKPDTQGGLWGNLAPGQWIGTRDSISRIYPLGYFWVPSENQTNKEHGYFLRLETERFIEDRGNSTPWEELRFKIIDLNDDVQLEGKVRRMDGKMFVELPNTFCGRYDFRQQVEHLSAVYDEAVRLWGDDAK